MHTFEGSSEIIHRWTSSSFQWDRFFFFQRRDEGTSISILRVDIRCNGGDESKSGNRDFHRWEDSLCLEFTKYKITNKMYVSSFWANVCKNLNPIKPLISCFHQTIRLYRKLQHVNSNHKSCHYQSPALWQLPPEMHSGRWISRAPKSTSLFHSERVKFFAAFEGRAEQ